MERQSRVDYYDTLASRVNDRAEVMPWLLALHSRISCLVTCCEVGQLRSRSIVLFHEAVGRPDRFTGGLPITEQRLRAPFSPRELVILVILLRHHAAKMRQNALVAQSWRVNTPSASAIQVG